MRLALLCASAVAFWPSVAEAQLPGLGHSITFRAGVSPSPSNLSGCQNAYGSLGMAVRSTRNLFAYASYDYSYRIDMEEGTPCVVVQRHERFGRIAFGETLDLGGASRIEAGVGHLFRGQPVGLELAAGGGALYAASPERRLHPWLSGSLGVLLFGERLVLRAEQGFTRSPVLYRVYSSGVLLDQEVDHHWSRLATFGIGLRF